ncbi:MAG: hypothetical protein M1820_007423 [Bogoriella megaspora]|nr:MAG: hypothetical protein M1820_007423 [Bogoriella megaspora]
MSTMITFAADNDLFRKRKRVYRACESCKKRRKRCDHTFTDEETTISTISPPGQKLTDQLGNTNVGSDGHRLTSDTSLGTASTKIPIEGIIEAQVPNGRSPNPSRFIGDMTPESVLRRQIQGRGIGGPSHSQIGYFVSANDSDSEGSKNDDRPSSAGLATTASTENQRKLRIQAALNNYLEALGASLLPSESDTDALLDIYFSNVQPLVPIVNEQELRTSRDNGTAPKMLVQAMCLVASRHDSARPYLRLADETEMLLEPLNFADRLYSRITAALNAHLETDKLVLIQVNALLSLNREVSAEHDDSSIHLAKAIQYAHSIGLHLGRAKKEHRDESMEKLFWCLWGLDKLANGSINARPTQLKEADIGLTNMMNMKKYRHTAFGMWLRLCTYLEKIITFYRPSADPASTGWEEDFPSFEDVVGSAGDKLEYEIITLLELLYHCVAMLSCRSRSTDAPTRSTPSYVRASLSAVRVISIMSSPSAKNLPPLPIADWSLALAMSFAYRQYRQSKLSMHKMRAKEDLERCCQLLDGLKSIWHSAGLMAEMGKAAINKANKVSRATDDRFATAPSGVKGPVSKQRNHHRDGSDNSMPPPAQRSSVENSHHGLNFEPFQLESPTSIPGQHPISSTRGDYNFGEGAGNTPSGSTANFEGVFDNIDAVLGSYPDLNFPIDFSDALANLDNPVIQEGSDGIFMG